MGAFVDAGLASLDASAAELVLVLAAQDRAGSAGVGALLEELRGELPSWTGDAVVLPRACSRIRCGDCPVLRRIPQSRYGLRRRAAEQRPTSESPTGRPGPRGRAAHAGRRATPAIAKPIVLRIWGCNGAVAQQFKLNGVATEATVAGAVGVTFFQDIDFGGSYSAPQAKGDYAALPADIPNDWINSPKIPAGWVVDAYTDGNFGGTRCTFTSDTAWVGSGCNDRFSSLRIH